MPTIAVSGSNFVVVESNHAGYYRPHVFRSKEQFQAWLKRQPTRKHGMMPAQFARGNALPAEDHRQEVEYIDIEEEEHQRHLSHIADEYAQLDREALVMTTTQQQQPTAKPQTSAALEEVKALRAEVTALKAVIVEWKTEAQRQIAQLTARIAEAAENSGIAMASVRQELTDTRHALTAMAAARIDPPQQVQAEREHYCAIHGVDLARHEKDGKVWYSHRAPDQSWCRGK